MPVERRIDPEDGQAYTFDELAGYYKGTYKKKVIEAYWEDSCKPAKSKAAGKAKTKAKSKAKAKKLPSVDYSGLEKGTVLQAMSEDGTWYAATVVTVAKAKGKAAAPVKVNYKGYTSASDEWLGADRLRSKLLKKSSSSGATKSKQEEKRPAPAMDVVPMLKRLAGHAAKNLPTAIVESSSTSDMVKISYAQLLETVKQNSAKIASLLAGLKEGVPKHVAYLVNPSIAYVVVELSVWAAGAACVPLSVHSPAPELEYFIDDSEAPLTIADSASSAKLKPVAEKLSRRFATIEPGADALTFTIAGEAGGDRAEGDTNITMLNHALILYTSGTTGKPKGAVHTFKSVTAQYTSLSKAWKWSSKDYTLHVLPLHHIHGVQNILNTALFNGAGVEFTPFDAGFCLKRICSGDITCFHAVPTIYVKFTQHLEKLDAEARDEIQRGLRNSSLRYMVSGSAALPVPTMTSWAEISGHVLLERYGMTEIGMGLSNKIVGTRYPGCVGWPLPSVKVKTDEEGAILIKAPQVFKEYYRKEEATKKEFTEDGWFKTGDSCQVGGEPEEIKALQEDAIRVDKATGRPKIDPESKPPASLTKIYKIMGRSSVDIIKSGGYKISALEIESVLLQHEAIKECAVVGKPDETWGEKVTAVCVLKGGTLAIKDLRDWGKERMATYKVPQELEVVDELPRNQMGKLEKKKILDRYKK
jgi:malonyl-CoA/methylmalonyl-CoA synthetase